MPHAVYTRHLGRSGAWRKATVRSLAQALLIHDRIETTLARAKEAQRLAERLITLGKEGSLAARRQAIRLLDDTSVVHRLFSEVAPRFSKRPGGYTRILHAGFRNGDNASLAVLELVEMHPQKEGSRLKGKQAAQGVSLKPAPVEKERREGIAGPSEPAPGSGRPPKRTETPRSSQESAQKDAQGVSELRDSEPKDAEAERKRKKEKSKGFLEGLRAFFKKRPRS